MAARHGLATCLHYLELSPAPELDLTPFLFAITGFALAWALLRYQLLDIIPVARNAIINSMSDGMIVLNPQNYVIDMNPAAHNMLNELSGTASGKSLIGLDVQQVLLSVWPNLTAYLHSDSKEYSAVVNSTFKEKKRYFDVNISPLYPESAQFSGAFDCDTREHRARARSRCTKAAQAAVAIHGRAVAQS